MGLDLYLNLEYRSTVSSAKEPHPKLSLQLRQHLSDCKQQRYQLPAKCSHRPAKYDSATTRRTGGVLADPVAEYVAVERCVSLCECGLLSVRFIESYWYLLNIVIYLFLFYCTPRSFRRASGRACQGNDTIGRLVRITLELSLFGMLFTIILLLFRTLLTHRLCHTKTENPMPLVYQN